MTKKDYVLIAEAIRNARNEVENSAVTSLQHADQNIMADKIVNNLIDSLYRDNQRFDARRFREATEI